MKNKDIVRYSGQLSVTISKFDSSGGITDEHN